MQKKTKVIKTKKMEEKKVKKKSKDDAQMIKIKTNRLIISSVFYIKHINMQGMKK